MAVQLILKNSAVQDKEATAAQLAAGELALNYHSSGPFLQCEDTAGNVWRLGGVVIASTAPSSPSKGAWWLDSDDDSLYFYDGSSWIEIQTGETAPGDITEGTARQLLQTNAAGNGTEWTSNIDVPGTLDVTGVATFDNNVVITGNLTVNGTTTTIDTTTLVVEDKNIEMGAVGTPTDSTADGGGITLKGATDKTINWVNATDAWTSSERFDFPAGTAAAPSIILNGDANSGIYQPGADQVAISTGGTGRLFIDASGRVLMGTTTEGESTADDLTIATTGHTGITIRSGTSQEGNIFFSDGTSGSDELRGAVRYYHSNNSLTFTTDATERLRIDSSGRLLVGTSGDTRTTSMIISGNSFSSAGQAILNMDIGTTTISDGDSIGVFRFGATGDRRGADIRAEGAGTWSAGTSHPTDLIFATNASGSASTPTERMRIDSSGNVGIGTTPNDVDSIGRALNIASSSGGAIYLQDTDSLTGKFAAISYNGSTAGLQIHAHHSSSFIDLGTNGAERLRIDSSGRVGIGTSSPGTDGYSSYDNLVIAHNDHCGITIKSPSNKFCGINFSDTAGSIAGYIAYEHSSDKLYFGNAGSGHSAFDSSGRLGIGTTSPGSFQSDANQLVIGSGSAGQGLTIFSGTSSLGNIAFADGTTGNEKYRGSIDYNHSNDALTLSTAATGRLVIDSSGRVLVGTPTDASPFAWGLGLQVGGTSTNAGVSIRRDQNTSGGALLMFSKSRGSLNGNTIVQDGDQIGGIYFNGADGTDTNSLAAQIAAYVDGTPGSNDMPGRLVFSTTADGASSPTERVRIEQSGKTKFSGAAYGVENTITASAFNLNSGNLWTCGAIAIPNPTNAVAGLMGSIRVTAAPTSFGSNFDHPGGSYTAPTSFPAVAPFYCVSSTNILLGSWTEGIA